MFEGSSVKVKFSNIPKKVLFPSHNIFLHAGIGRHFIPMELDKRVGDYAAAIVRDIDLLLEDAANLNDEQRQSIVKIKSSMIHFMSLYNEYLSLFSDSAIERQTLSFEFRTPLTSIAGFCDLLTLEVLGALNALQRQRVQQIKVAQEFISDAFNTRMNQGHVSN